MQAVVECTSYWYWVADGCGAYKVPLTLAHAKMLKAISYAKVKTDSVDARTLAELLRVGLIPEAHQCRLVPGSKDSGGTRRHRSKNKDGNRYLRIAFNQAAIIAYRDYPVVKEFYKKITRRSGKHVARTVVGKELAKIVWHMLSKNEKYKGFKGRMTTVTTQNYWPQPISPNA